MQNHGVAQLKKKKVSQKETVIRFGLLCDFREGLREWTFALGAVETMGGGEQF